MRRTRRWFGAAVTLMLAAGLASGGTGSAATDQWTPPHCSNAGALIEYHSTDGWTYDEDLVIKPDRRAALCWDRRPGNRSGRRDFVVAKGVMHRLLVNLRIANCRPTRPSPPPSRPPVPPDTPVASVEYHGRRARCSVSETARRRADDRAWSILSDMVDRRTPSTAE
jgi:hypothetical protein